MSTRLDLARERMAMRRERAATRPRPLQDLVKGVAGWFGGGSADPTAPGDGPLTGIWGRIREVFFPIVQDAGRTAVLEVGLPLAEGIVATLEEVNLPGAEKKEKARGLLKTALLGLKVITGGVQNSLLDLVIQMALEKVRSVAAAVRPVAPAAGVESPQTGGTP